MFKENREHLQASVFDAEMWMPARARKNLGRSWAKTFYDEVFANIDEKPFAKLFGGTGHPNFPVNILLSLEYIKHMKGYTDEDLLERYGYDYLVNYAVGNKSVGARPMAARTLYNFRARVYEYSVEHPGEDDILYGQFVGLLKRFAAKAGIDMGEQRADTTMFMSNIKKAGRMALAYDVLAKGVRAIPEGLRTEGLAEALGPKFKTDTLYRLKGDERDGRLAAMLGLCREALGILGGLPSGGGEAARVLGRFLGEQAEEGADGSLAARDKHKISAGSLQSAYDEDATYHKKGSVGQSGYSLEISETCGEGNPFQLLTDYRTNKNNVADTEAIQERIGRIRENTGCGDMYADGGFYSPAVIKAAADAGIEMHYTNLTGSEPSKKMAASEFGTDAGSKLIESCPARNTPMSASVGNAQSVARFPLETCASCALLETCPAKLQKKDAVVRISLKSIDACAERAKMKASQAGSTSKRAAIEGSNSALKRSGLGKLAVRGLAKCQVVAGLKVAAQNIKRLVKYMSGGYGEKNKPAPAAG